MSEKNNNLFTKSAYNKSSLFTQLTFNDSALDVNLIENNERTVMKETFSMFRIVSHTYCDERKSFPFAHKM